MKSKRILTLVAHLGAATLLLSCQSILDKARPDAISSGSMWTTAPLSESGINGLMYPFYYRWDGSVTTYFNKNGKMGLDRIGIEACSFTSDYFANGSPLSYLSNSSKNSNMTLAEWEWRMLYTTIHACNSAMAGIREDVLGEAVYNQYYCEARMIRAYCYSRLAMIFGGVPLYLEPVNNEECTRGQSSWEEVWQAVIDDCTACIDNLYFQTNNLSGDRMCKPSKGMAYAIRGMARMWLASDLGQIVDPASGSLSESEIKDLYTLAENDFEAVGTCGFGLWEGQWEDLFTTENEHNKEMIFPLEFSTAVSGFTSYWQMVIGTRSHLYGWNNIKPSVDFVDSYQNADGTAFSWSQVFPEWDDTDPALREVWFLRDSLKTNSKYSKLRSAAVERIGTSYFNANYIDIGNEARLRKAYDNRDPRLEKTVVTPYKKYRFYNASMGETPRNLQLRWPYYKNESTVENSDLWPDVTTSMYYYYYKYLTTDGSVDDREYGGTDWPIIRFTQIQLQRAEALTHLGKLSEAKDLVDEIRSRAGMPPVNATTVKDMLEAIRYESRVELCQEGVNYFEEIRWGTYQQSKFLGKYVHCGMNLWSKRGYEYDWYYVEEMWPWSAPLVEIQMNSNLKKREGWVY